MGLPRLTATSATDLAKTGSDVELWSSLVSHDPSGLAGLFDRHAQAVYNFAFRRTTSWASAEDVTQATFLTLWRRAAAGQLPPLEHPSALPWLLGVADRESRRVHRTLLRRRRLQHRLDGVHPTESPGSDHAEAVSQRLDDQRRMAQVRDAVRVLPAHQRVIVELVVWSGLSLREAATALGVAEGTVKSRLSRAKSRLKVQLSSPDRVEEQR